MVVAVDSRFVCEDEECEYIVWKPSNCTKRWERVGRDVLDRIMFSWCFISLLIIKIHII